MRSVVEERVLHLVNIMRPRKSGDKVLLDALAVAKGKHRHTSDILG